MNKRTQKIITIALAALVILGLIVTIILPLAVVSNY